MEELHTQVRRALANRHGPEAAALFRALYDTVQRRASRAVQRRWQDVLTDADVDEVVAEVMHALIEGALGRFRGHTTGQLHAFVHTITDRAAARRAHRLLQERDTVREATGTTDAMFARAPALPPDRRAEVDIEDPLAPADRVYLEALLHAGSKAEMARRRGVSRAAVTQRLHRIRDRVDHLSEGDQARHRAWLLSRARDALEAEQTQADERVLEEG